MKKLVVIIFVCVLSISAFGVDFSRISNEKLIEMSGRVEPKDYPDYKMEIFKRTQEMKVKDAKIFHEKLREQRRNAYDAMSLKERREYRNAIHFETQKRIDAMSVKEAREKGLLKGYKYYREQDRDLSKRGECLPCSKK